MFADPPEPLALSDQPPAEEARWTTGDLLLGLVALVGVIGAVVALIVLVRPRGFAAGVAATLGFEVAMALIVLALARRRGISLRALGFVAPRSWWSVVGIWIATYSVLFAYAVGLALLDGAGIDVGRFSGGNPIPLPRDASREATLGLAAAVVLAAPFAEELYFRAFVFRATRRRLGLLAAALLSGALFAGFHANLAVVLPFTLVGALFAWGFETSGSLWTSIAAHFLVNGLGFVATLARLTERG